MKPAIRFFWMSLVRHDFKASITVVFVALPLCLGIALASGAPPETGLISGIIGGLVVSLLSKSALSVSGPAAGLTAICAAAILRLGPLELFFMAVALAGVFQFFLGVFRLGSFTHFIPNSVIRGMLAAIGLLLISKQIPFILGYSEPDFWSKELVNLFSLSHGFDHVRDLYQQSSVAAVVVAGFSIGCWMLWEKFAHKKIPWIPVSFVIAIAGSGIAAALRYWPVITPLAAKQFVTIPSHVFTSIHFPTHLSDLFHSDILTTALTICFVASLETVLSTEAIDKIDPLRRVTPQNRELMAQGAGNMLSGILGGLPITAVIVRSSANTEAGARTFASSFLHGFWLLLIALGGSLLVSYIPYGVLAVILIRTGYGLARPSLFRRIWKQGREQFIPFIVTVFSILVTDLLMGVVIGILYSIWFIFKHTYRAGFTWTEQTQGHAGSYVMQLAIHVSFLNKKRILEQLDKVPPYSTVEVDGSRSNYIDHDVLEIFQDFSVKARNRHISLVLKNIQATEHFGAH